uniref:Cadherin domain-containing protein n=1 Tax=Macrostomum lignano TaxID=282301 RepID=A0A1I8J347_9PLAT
ITDPAASSDFFGTSYPVVFYAGVTPGVQTVTFTTVDDDLPEDDETYTISLTVRGTATLVAPTTVNVTILANDDAYGIFSFKAPRQSWVREPATAVPTMVSLEIIRDRGLFNSVQLGFRVDGGANPAATPGLDVGPAEGQLLFTAGVFSLMLQLQIMPDVIPENNETFTVSLSILGTRGSLAPGASTYSITVLANDAPVRFEFAQYSVNETNSDTDYRIGIIRGSSASGGLIGPVDFPASVAVRVSNVGLAGLYSDYRAVNQTLQFAAGETRKEITITVLADDIPEPVEDFSLTLQDPTGDMVIQEPQTAKILINANDDPNGVLEMFTNIPGQPGFYTVDEDSTSTFSDFKVVRSGGIYGPVSVGWMLVRVNNTDPIVSDIGPSEGTVKLEDRVKEASISLKIIQDTLPEPAEAFRISLVASTLTGGAKLGSITTGVLVVQDSDMAYGLVSFSTPDQQILKSKQTPRTLEFRIIRTGGTLGAIRIAMDVTYSGSTNVTKEDKKSFRFNITCMQHELKPPPCIPDIFTASLPTVVPMGIGEASALVQLPLTERAFLQVGETFNARLLNASYTQPVSSLPAYNSPRLGARLETSILVAPGDADGEVGFASIGVILADEPSDGAASSFVPIRIVREGMSGAAVIYWNVTSVGPGVTDSDTGPRSGQINLAAGQTSADLVFEIKPDDVPELDEDLTIQLTDVAPAGTQRLKTNYSSIVLKIRANDNPGGVFSFASFMKEHYLMKEEGDPINVTVVRTGGALMTVLVDYSVQPGGDAQFYGGNNVLQFLPGVYSLSGTLLARGENIPELDTNYILSLSGHNGVPISIGSRSRINITVPANDDPSGVIEFQTSSLLANIKESKGSDIQIARLIVARNRGAFGTVTVQFRVTPGNTSDLSPISGTLVFENGQSQVALPIQSLPDDIPEDQEQFTVTLFNVTGGASLGSRAQAFVYIDQNDSPVYFSAPSTLRVNEGQSASFTVVREGSLLESVRISYRTIDVTAYAGINDYISASGVLVFNSGQREQRLSVQTLDDRTPEGDEILRIELYNPLGDIVPYNQYVATVVIAANDGASGSISFASTVVKTANEGSSVSFEVIREGGIFGDVNIYWMIALNGTEEPVADGTDFDFGSGVLTLPNGAATVPLVLIPRRDNVPEFDENFSVTMVNLTGGASPEEKPVFGSGPTKAYIVVPQNDDPYGVMSFGQSTYSVPEDAYPGQEAETKLTVSVDRLQGRYSKVEVSWTILSQSASSLPAVMDLLFLGLQNFSVVTADVSKRIPGTGTQVLEFFNAPGTKETDLIPSDFIWFLGSLVTVPAIYQPNATTTMNSASGFAFSTALQLKQSIADSCLLSKFFSNNGSDLYGVYISANATSVGVTFRYWSLFRRTAQLSGWMAATILDAKWHYLVVNVFGGQASFFLDGVKFYQGALESATLLDTDGVMHLGAAAGQTHRYIGYLQDARLYARKLENNEIAEISSYPASSDVTPISGHLSFPIDQLNSTITLASVQDTIAEPDEYFTLRLLSAKGGARLSPTGQSSDLVVLKSDAANGIFGFVGSCVPPVSFNESTTFSCSVQRLGGSFDSVNLYWEARLPNHNGTGWSEAGSQFVNSTGFITFGAGERLKSLTATLVDDQIPELATQAIFILTEAASSDGQAGSTNVSGASIDPRKNWINVTISESDYPYGYLQFMTALPDPLPSIIPAEFNQPQISVREEVGFVSLLIARAQGTMGSISCEWRTRDGTATSSGDRPDYRADGNRIQFLSGSRLARFNVTIYDNALPEDTRVFYVELLNPIGGAGLGPASTVAVSIENSDSAYGVFGFAPMSLVIYTDEVANGTALFTVTRAGGTLRAVTIYWEIPSDPNNDLITRSGRLDFAAGQTVGYFTVGVYDDSLPEVDESFNVILNNASLGTIDPKKAQATLIIRANDNPYGVFSISDVYRPIRVEEVSEPANIRITRSGGSMGAVRISYRTLSHAETFPFLPIVVDRATENADFAAVTGYVDMSPGQTSATFSVGILDDPIPEPDESFFVVLTGIRLLNSSSTGPEVLPQLDLNHRTYAQVIISLNDNANGILDFSAAETLVPEEKAGPFLFLQRKGGQFGVVTALFEIISITADPVTDIRVTSNQITFGSGETNKSVPVFVVDDSIPETQEDFRIRLTGEVSGGAVLGTVTSCLVTIAASDDPNGVFVFSTLGITVDEPDAGLIPVQMTISRLAGQIGVVSVSWEARLNGIKIDTDVTPAEGTLIFVSNENSKSLVVNVRADNVSEGREDVQIVLTRASNGGRLGDSNTFTLSILPNDDPYGVVEFKQSNFFINEVIGDNLQNVTIVRKMGVFNQLRITYSLNNTPLLPIIANLSRTVYNYFMSPYYGFPREKGIAVNISSEADKQQACLLTCLEARACQAVYFYISTGACSWYSSSDTLSLDPDSRARYYVKNLAETHTLYQNLAEVGVDVLPYNDGVFIYPPGLNEAQLSVLVKDDTLPELDESFVITLTSAEVITTDPLTPKIMPRLGTLLSANVTIRANDNANGLFRLYSPDTRAEMGGSLIRVPEQASLAVELVVERSGGSIGYASVDWKVNAAKSTATNFADFRADGATLTFGPSETRRVFTIAILDDNIPELFESVVLDLNNPTGGAAIDPEKQTVSVIIEANDLVAGMIGFAQNTLLVDKGQRVSIDVLRSFPGEGNVSVSWRISDLGVGYNASETFEQTTGVIHFSAHVLDRAINVTILEDSKPSVDESFSIQLVGVNTSGVETSGAAQIDATKREMVLTVRAHNRPHGLFQLASGTLNQTTDEVNKTVSILVLRKFGSIGRVRVHFMQTNVSSLPPLTAEAAHIQDYTVEPFYIDFQDGEVQKSINISIVDDNIPEIDEIIQFTLTRVEYLGPGTTSYPPALDNTTELSASVTIRANDGTTGVVIFPPGSDGLSVNETRQKILLTVLRTMGTFGTVSVFYYSQLVTAQSTDFDIQPSTLVFNPGETEKTIEVLILDDDIPESDEAFQVVLGNPTNGLLLGTPSVAVITILSNDGAGGALNFDSAADVQLSEPGDGIGFPAPKVMFNVIRGPGTFGKITFEFVVTRLDGTNDNLTDIGPLSGAITMENLQTTASFEVSATADDTPETARTYLVRLINPKLGATLGTVIQRRVTIVDNDSPYGRINIVSISGPSGYYTVREANSALTVSMVRSHGLVNRVSFDLQVLPRTASATSGAVLMLNSLQEVRATSLRRWVTYELADSLTYMLMLSSYRVAPLPAVAIGSDGSDGPYDARRITTSVVYRWQGRLEPVQTVMTDFAVDAAHFTINSQHYLAIVNQGSNDRPDTATRVYRVNQETGALNFTQDIPTVYGSSVTFYSVDGGNYLFIASYQNAKAETTVYSSVYKWDDVNQRFGAATMQLINTQGASDSLSFEQGGLRFLLVLNYFDSTSNSYTIGSVLYRYESLKASFVVHQTMPTRGAKAATIFNIGSQMFLVIANNRDGPILNSVDSVVYRWQGSNFVLHQTIPTRDAVNVFAFQGVNTVSYFGITSNSGSTIVMGWNSSSSLFVQVTTFGSANQYQPVVVKQSTTSLLLLAHVNSTFDVDGATSQIYMVSTIAPISDFVPATMTMTLEEGQTHTATSVFVLDDDTSEPDEHFELVLDNPKDGVQFGAQKSASITILANDNPYGEINFDVSSRHLNVEELSGKDNSVLLSMTRTGGTFARVLIQFAVVGDVTNDDIAPMSGTAEFAKGSALATITLTVKDDAIPELDERAIVMLTRVTTDATNVADEYPTIGPFSNCTLLILANDNPHGVIGWEELVVRTTEPDGMEGTVYLTLVRSQGAIGNIRISFTTYPDHSVPPNQRATAGQDYLAALSIVTMNNNQTRAQVAMIILMDTTPELTESFLVNITGVQLLDSTPASGTQPTIKATAVTCQVLIAENDNARGIVQFNVTENLEGYVIAYEGIHQLLLQVSRTVGFFGNQTITWEAKPQTATAEDYNPSSGQVTIYDQMKSATIAVNVVDDTIPETTETFLVQLVRIDGGAVIGEKNSITVAIPPNDSPYGQFQFANSPVTVKESASLNDPNGLAVLTVQRTQSAVGRVSMTWQLEPAAQGDFLEPFQGLLVFEEGETFKNFTLRTKPDNITEGQKSFRVSLVLSGTVGDISPTRGDAVIIIQADPGSSGLISVAQASKRVLLAEKEVSTDSGEARITVTRGSGTNGEVQVFWTLIPRDIDNFVETQGTLVIPDSVPTGDIVLRAVDDSVPEVAKVYLLLLTGVQPSLATLSPTDNQATVIMRASDFPYGLFEFASSAPIVRPEANSLVEISVQRLGGTFGTVFVNFATRNGSATAGSDYAPVLGYLTFGPGVSRATVSVQLLDDTVPEGPEDFYLVLTSVSLINPTNISTETDQAPGLGANFEQRLVIDKNDQAEGVIQFAPAGVVFEVDESVGVARVPVTRAPGSYGRVSCRYTSRNLTATPGIDYVLLDLPVVFENGQTEQTINVTIVDDSEPEFDEQLQITLTSPGTGAALL